MSSAEALTALKAELLQTLVPQVLDVLILTFGVTAAALTAWAMLRGPARSPVAPVVLEGRRAEEAAATVSG